MACINIVAHLLKGVLLYAGKQFVSLINEISYTSGNRKSTGDTTVPSVVMKEA